VSVTIFRNNGKLVLGGAGFESRWLIQIILTEIFRGFPHSKAMDE
jgi:hypothetical protein